MLPNLRNQLTKSLDEQFLYDFLSEATFTRIVEIFFPLINLISFMRRLSVRFATLREYNEHLVNGTKKFPTISPGLSSRQKIIGSKNSLTHLQRSGFRLHTCEMATWQC